jgi:hypothetical protein
MPRLDIIDGYEPFHNERASAKSGWSSCCGSDGDGAEECNDLQSTIGLRNGSVAPVKRARTGLLRYRWLYIDNVL